MRQIVEEHEGHLYLVTYNAAGVEVSRECRDVPPDIPTKAINTKVVTLLATPGPWNSTQITAALKLIIAGLYGMRDE